MKSDLWDLIRTVSIGCGLMFFIGIGFLIAIFNYPSNTPEDWFINGISFITGYLMIGLAILFAVYSIRDYIESEKYNKENEFLRARYSRNIKKYIRYKNSFPIHIYFRN